MSRISRAGRVRAGLGENKARGSPAPTPLPPRFLPARDGAAGAGSVGAGGSPLLPARARGAAGLCLPQFPLPERRRVPGHGVAGLSLPVVGCPCGSCGVDEALGMPAVCG